MGLSSPSLYPWSTERAKMSKADAKVKRKRHRQRVWMPRHPRRRRYFEASNAIGESTMPDAVSLHDLSTLSPAQRAQLLVRSEADLGPILEKVKPIIAAVK